VLSELTVAQIRLFIKRGVDRIERMSGTVAQPEVAPVVANDALLSRQFGLGKK